MLQMGLQPGSKLIKTQTRDRFLSGSKPLNIVQLGWVTWPILHRMSLSYPEKPTEAMKDAMGQVVKGFAMMYPCSHCREDFKDKIKEFPPKLDSRTDFALWVCEQHNLVNEKLMKPTFKCNIKRLELMYGRKSQRSWTD